jgi:VWFA-related protein
MRIAACGVAIALAVVTLAQETPTISVSTNLVSILANVRDNHGMAIKGLTQEDFVLQDNGIRQNIQYFSKETELPLTVGLVVDTSRSQVGVIEQERRACRTFLGHVLQESKDRAFLTHFDASVSTLQGITALRSDLSAALNRLAVPGEYATLIYSAIQDASDNVLKKEQGRKALILLTDGVAFKDPVSLEEAIQSAQQSNVIIYTIRFSDKIPVARPVRAAILAAASEHGKAGLRRIAKETGGSPYEVSKSQSIETVFSQIEEALRTQYSIFYRPEPRDVSGKYHKISLTTKDTHLIVTARDGYYATEEAQIGMK